MVMDGIELGPWGAVKLSEHRLSAATSFNNLLYRPNG